MLSPTIRAAADNYAASQGAVPDGSLLFTKLAEAYEAGYQAAPAAASVNGGASQLNRELLAEAKNTIEALGVYRTTMLSAGEWDEASEAGRAMCERLYTALAAAPAAGASPVGGATDFEQVKALLDRLEIDYQVYQPASQGNEPVYDVIELLQVASEHTQRWFFINHPGGKTCHIGKKQGDFDTTDYGKLPEKYWPLEPGEVRPAFLDEPAAAPSLLGGGAAARQWISAAERLPELVEGQSSIECIVFANDKVSSASYTRNQYAKTEKARIPRWEWHFRIWPAYFGEITHWQPLPKAPAAAPTQVAIEGSGSHE